MNHRIAVIGVGGLCALVLGLGLYLRAGADSPDTGLPEPQVPGRLLVPIEAQGVDSSGTTYCEFDAHVTLKDQQVVEVDRLGANTQVEPGEKVAEDFDIKGPIMVYRAEDGLLHVGCAPESVVKAD